MNNNKFFFRTSILNDLSIVKSILNTISSIDSSEEFVVEMLKACMSMIEPKARNKFANMVRFNDFLLRIVLTNKFN